MSVDVLRFESILQGEEVAYAGTESERPAAFARLPEELAPSVQEAIGVPALYTHQRAFWEAAARGEHVCVTTGTASGKSLAFNLPVLDAVARDPKLRALFLYPTKALAQDQFRALDALALPGVRAAIYDGDTPSEHRREIRRRSNVILTNPDMLHIGVLPNHDRWGDVLANLRYVVLDEAHVYRGVFGSHVANVVRRLRRLARIYGADPQLLLASATISNPGELGAGLLGDRVTVVGDDGAPRAERTVVLWNPPLLDAELGLRGSALAEAAKLQALLVERGLRTLTFAKSRKAAELIHRFTAERLGDDAHLSPYRAGYTAAQRREIERRLFDGDLLGVSATNALELGSTWAARLRDHGRLPGHRCVAPTAMGPGRQARPRPGGAGGFRGRARPVLHARARQAAGAPRRGGDPRPREPAGPRRTRARGRLRGAADRGDAGVLGPEALELATQDPELRRTKSGIVWGGRDHPAARVSLRSADADAITIVDASSGTVLGQVERARAHSTVHDGAVYLHLGESYLVSELDLTTRHALVEPFSGNWYTQAKKETMTAIVEPQRSEERLGLTLHFGELEVTEQVVGYERRTVVTGADRARSAGAAADELRDRGVVVLPEPGQLEGLDQMPKLLGTLHAAEHALIALLPLWAMCDRWDIGGLSTNVHPQTGRPTVFVYDGHPGGVGITERGFREFEGWVADTAELVRGCPAPTAARRACRARSAGISTTCSTRRVPPTFLTRLVDFGNRRSS